MEFKERIMLAVTEVNGCAMCSFAHAQMALESGMGSDEIAAMLAGETSAAPSEELPAVLFAQHYADSRGKPSHESWMRIKEQYGEKKALAILGAVRVIMMGNTYGIPFGSLKSRFTGHRETVDKRSSVPYEIGMILSIIVYLPAGLIQTLLAVLFRRFVIEWEER